DQPEQGQEAGDGEEGDALAAEGDPLGDLGLGQLDLVLDEGGDVVGRVRHELTDGPLGLARSGLTDEAARGWIGRGAGGVVVAHAAPGRDGGPPRGPGCAPVSLPTRCLARRQEAPERLWRCRRDPLGAWARGGVTTSDLVPERTVF